MSGIFPYFSCLTPLPKVEHNSVFFPKPDALVSSSKWPNSISWCRYSNKCTLRSTTQSVPKSKSNGAYEEEEEKEDPFLMGEEERQEWRRKIREVIDRSPDVDEETDPVEKMKKMQQLLADYPLVVDEEDPDWPEDADGRGFNLDQFFNKITIKNNKKKDDDDDDDVDDDSEHKVVWQDDDYIRPIKDIVSSDWEETVFKDISPLMVLVHNRYKRPKENDRMRFELEKAVNIIWNCRLPSPRCVAIDAVVEDELVSALKVSNFPELIFIKKGRIVFRQNEIPSADELSKMMAFFYFGATKPPCLNHMTNREELIPTISINNNNIINVDAL